MNVNISYRPQEVDIGGYTLFCEKFRAERTRTLAEKTTVSGENAVTNSGRKSLRLTFTGRIASDEQPTGLLYEMDTLMASGTGFSVEYGDLVFSGCHLLSFSTEDGGEGVIQASVTLYCTGGIERQEGAE